MIIERHIKALLVATLLLGASAYAQEDDTGPSPMDQVVPVGPEETAEIDEPVAPAATDTELLIQEFARFKELLNSGAYDEADTAAKRTIELALKAKGPRSIETAKALTNLAIVQDRTEQYDPAQQNYQSAIEIIEETDNRLSEHLVNPLKGLGAAQLRVGRPDLADGTFRRAVHITHVNEGPHNLYQIELLQALAEVSMMLGSPDDAKELLDRMYMLNVRQYAEDTMALIPPLIRRAQWQHRAGMIIDERVTYRRVIRIIEQNKGKNAVDLVQPLIAYGRSFAHPDMTGGSEFQQANMTSGEIYFKRALRISEQSPESNWKLRANANLALGDYYMHVNNASRGRKAYIAAWELLSEDEEPLEFRRNMLERAVLLEERQLPKYVNTTKNQRAPVVADQFLEATLKVSYAVSARGRVSSLKIVEAEPPDFTDMHRVIQRLIRARTYRPRYENAEPVETPNQLLVHTFLYRQADLDALRSEAEETEEPVDADAS